MVCPGFCHAGGWGGVPVWGVTKNTANRRILAVSAARAPVPDRVPDWSYAGHARMP